MFNHTIMSSDIPTWYVAVNEFLSSYTANTENLLALFGVLVTLFISISVYLIERKSKLKIESEIILKKILLVKFCFPLFFICFISFFYNCNLANIVHLILIIVFTIMTIIIIVRTYLYLTSNDGLRSKNYKHTTQINYLRELDESKPIYYNWKEYFNSLSDLSILDNIIDTFEFCYKKIEKSNERRHFLYLLIIYVRNTSDLYNEEFKKLIIFISSWIREKSNDTDAKMDVFWRIVELCVSESKSIFYRFYDIGEIIWESLQSEESKFKYVAKFVLRYKKILEANNISEIETCFPKDPEFINTINEYCKGMYSPGIKDLSDFGKKLADYNQVQI